MPVDVSKCIECGKCTKVCLFLEKYDMNLKDYADRKDLAFHCYLCGECKRVCPVDIDGRQLSLDLREERINEGYDLYKNGYGVLLHEKRNYIFKNYKNVTGKKAFFPGCNFPAYYPETTKSISKTLRENHEITTIFDCCGKPLADLSMEKERVAIDNRLTDRLEELGIEELVLLCPNCYYYFKYNSNIKVSMIYEDENIMKDLISKEGLKNVEGNLFLPCPDKDSRKLYKMLKKYIDIENLNEIKDIQCCGAGGCASVKEKELTKEMRDDFKEYKDKIYLYCGTCAGVITKSNTNVEHIMCKLLNTKEKVNPGIKSLKNRVVFFMKKQG